MRWDTPGIATCNSRFPPEIQTNYKNVHREYKQTHRQVVVIDLHVAYELHRVDELIKQTQVGLATS